MRRREEQVCPMYKRDRAPEAATGEAASRQSAPLPLVPPLLQVHQHGGMCKLENGSGCRRTTAEATSSRPVRLRRRLHEDGNDPDSHLSSTNSLESLQMSGGESTSSTAKSWPNSLLASRPLLSSKRYFDLTLTLHLKANLNCQWDFIFFTSIHFKCIAPFSQASSTWTSSTGDPTSRQPQFDSLGDAGEPRRQGSPPAGIPGTVGRTQRHPHGRTVCGGRTSTRSCTARPTTSARWTSLSCCPRCWTSVCLRRSTGRGTLPSSRISKVKREWEY